MVMCLLLLDVFLIVGCVCVFFFKQKTAYEMRISDWSSDVCSSDLRDRLALGVVDHLGIDVLARAMHRKPRAGARARTKRGAVAPAALFEKRKTLGHHFFFPSLRKMYSPRYLMPLPLYGSGLRQRRISAAT